MSAGGAAKAVLGTAPCLPPTPNGSCSPAFQLPHNSTLRLSQPLDRAFYKLQELFVVSVYDLHEQQKLMSLFNSLEFICLTCP